MKHFLTNRFNHKYSVIGFTLIELSVVLVLISLMAFILIPNLSDFGKEDLKYFSRKLNGIIQYLYAEASIKRENYYLVFDFPRKNIMLP